MALHLTSQLFPCPDRRLAHLGVSEHRVIAPASAPLGRQGHGRV